MKQVLPQVWQNILRWFSHWLSSSPHSFPREPFLTQLPRWGLDPFEPIDCRRPWHPRTSSHFSSWHCCSYSDVVHYLRKMTWWRPASPVGQCNLQDEGLYCPLKWTVPSCCWVFETWTVVVASFFTTTGSFSLISCQIEDQFSFYEVQQTIDQIYWYRRNATELGVAIMKSVFMVNDMEKKTGSKFQAAPKTWGSSRRNHKVSVILVWCWWFVVELTWGDHLEGETRGWD